MTKGSSKNPGTYCKVMAQLHQEQEQTLLLSHTLTHQFQGCPEDKGQNVARIGKPKHF